MRSGPLGKTSLSQLDAPWNVGPVNGPANGSANGPMDHNEP